VIVYSLIALGTADTILNDIAAKKAELTASFNANDEDKINSEHLIVMRPSTN
jgi:hypothetical protein